MQAVGVDGADQFVRQIHGADFVLRSDGVCRLNPQLAKRLAQLVGAALSSRRDATALLTRSDA